MVSNRDLLNHQLLANIGRAILHQISSSFKMQIIYYCYCVSVNMHVISANTVQSDHFYSLICKANYKSTRILA